MTSLHAPLDIVGQVQALMADETVLITAEGSVITIDLPTIRVGMTALRGVGRRNRRTRTVSAASSILQFADLTVQFRLAGGTIAKLGAGARPGILSRLLRLAPLEVKLSAGLSILRSFWH